MVAPNREDMERAKIVLDDALPYELDMLDAAVRYMQMDEFSKLTKPKTEIEWLICNAIIESFWTHARCLIEFSVFQAILLFDSMALSVRLPSSRAELAGRSGQAPPGACGMAERGLLRAPHRLVVQTAARGTPMRIITWRGTC